VLPNSHREITPHVKSPLREERGLACPVKSLPSGLLPPSYQSSPYPKLGGVTPNSESVWRVPKFAQCPNVRVCLD